MPAEVVAGSLATERLARGASACAAELRRDLVRLLGELTSVDAPTDDAAGLKRCARILARRLGELGGGPTWHRSEAGPHVEARFGPQTGRGVLLLCHYDTVWPAGTAGQRPFELRDGLARGPGVFDMRGGLVAALGAIEILIRLRSLAHPVAILLTADEESGGTASRELILERARAAELTLIPEPPLPGGGMKTSRKGWMVVRLSVNGRAAHAGLEPDAGVNAIDELADQLVSLRRLADPERGTTVTCGTVAGGTAPNIVAPAAEAVLDIRMTTKADADGLRAALSSLVPVRAQATLETAELHFKPPMERTPAIAAAAERAAELAGVLGIGLGEGHAGGVSDGNHIAAAGLAVLDGLGPEGGGAHAADELVSVDSMVERAALLALLAGSSAS